MTPQQQHAIDRLRDLGSQWGRVATLADIAETRAALVLDTLAQPAKGVPASVADWVANECRRIGEGA